MFTFFCSLTIIHRYINTLEISINSLQNSTGALLAEGVDLLTGEADQEAVLLFVIGDELDDVGHRLRHGYALYRGFPAQLLGDSALLL